jgi:methyl-accepting chemotaxis protein
MNITLGFKIRVGLLLFFWAISLYFNQTSIVVIGVSVAFIGQLLVLISTGVVLVYVWGKIITPYLEALRLAEEIGKGNTVIQTEIQDDLTKSLVNISANFDEAAKYSLAIGDGEFEKKMLLLNETKGLGFALNEMSLKLQHVAEEDRKRNWVFNGEAKFGDLLRKNQDQNYDEISFLYVKELVKYLGANQGGIYLINKEDEKNKFLKLVACYAFDKRKYQQQILDIDEGLLGQCIKDKDYVYLDDIPDNYIKITSGLGDANPKSILIVPLMVNEEVLGVVEIASFQTYKLFEIQFIQQVAQVFAATVSNMQNNTKTKILLEESRKATEELTAKEDDLKANSIELIKIQEALNEKLIEIEKESAYTQSIVTAINSTNASLVMDIDGNIIDVNDMFISIMEYSKEDLIGKPELNFVSADEISSERYQMLIDSVKAGTSNSGEFRRISKSGRELWITGSYSPIFDMNGVVYKIILFAQFTTEQKEKELELKSKIDAINNSIGSLELGLELNVISANPIFLSDFGYKRMELRGKKLDFVLEPSYFASDKFTTLWELVSDDNVISQEITMLTKEGKVKHYMANFSPSKNLEGHIHKVLVLLFDLTEQYLLSQQLDLLLKEAQRENILLELKVETNNEDFTEELVSLLTSIDIPTTDVSLLKLLKDKNVPYLKIDEQKTITSISDNMAQLLCYKQAECIGIPLLSRLKKDSDSTMASLDIINENALSQFKLPFETKDATTILMNVYIVPIKMETGIINYMLIMLNEEPDNSSI